MKSPAEYLTGQVFEASRPRREMQPVVAYATAVQAIEQALADAEKYKYLLMRALRHNDEPQAAPAASFFDDETPVRLLYPDVQDQLAA